MTRVRPEILAALVFALLLGHQAKAAGGGYLPSGLALSCSTVSVGILPLMDLGTGTYRGYQGGLYPGGVNVRPASHDSAGRALAAGVLPRNPSGGVDMANGRIVLLSIGMSNATQEFSVFKGMADSLASKNPRLTIVDGAQGGQTAAIIANRNASFWTVIDQRLAAAGMTRMQVQAAWVKEADASPSSGFPRHAQVLDSEFVLIARNLKYFYPNIALSYWSSRTYGGYATTSLNPEPYAFESGFAVKWTITRQISGDTALAYGGPSPRAPWLAWGPYLWADGLVPRSDGLTWTCDDFVSTDRTHPSATGRRKVAQMLLNFFTADTTAQGWFLRPGPTAVVDEDGVPRGVRIEQNYPNPFNGSTVIRYSVPTAEGGKTRGGGRVRLAVYDLLGREVALLVDGGVGEGTHSAVWDATGMPSGVYFYRLAGEGWVRSGTMCLIR